MSWGSLASQPIFQKGSFCAMCLFGRVEHNPILALSGGKQVVLLAVGPCEDLKSS